MQAMTKPEAMGWASMLKQLHAFQLINLVIVPQSCTWLQQWTWKIGLVSGNDKRIEIQGPLAWVIPPGLVVAINTRQSVS
jgi:hypothetical protein